MVFEGLVGLGVACLLAPVLAEYAGIMDKAPKGFSLIGGAGVLYILAKGFDMSMVFGENMPNIASSGAMLFDVLGWLFLLIGAIMVAYKLAAE